MIAGGLLVLLAALGTCAQTGVSARQKLHAVVSAQLSTSPMGGGKEPSFVVPHVADRGRDPDFAAGAASLSVRGATITQTATRPIHTSAGIFGKDGALLRTLWRRKDLAAGELHTVTWDHKDDLGRTVPDGIYQVKALAHNVEYKWQGVIGNTSHPGAQAAASKVIDMGGADVSLPAFDLNFHRGYLTIAGMAFGPGGKGFVARGYNEMQNAMFAVNAADMSRVTPLGHADFQRVFSLVATDGSIGYFANIGLHGSGIHNQPANFIVGFRPDGSQVDFQYGQDWTEGLGHKNHWKSVLDVVRDGVDQIQGIAVETNGSHLYVAHKNSGIKVLDKSTGRCRNAGAANVCNATIGVPKASALAVSPAGDLWVVANGGREVRKYRNPATSPTLVLTIGGFGKASAIGVSPLTSTVVVVDSGPDQQIKAYDASTGNQRWIQGVKGGYVRNGPDVTSTKLNFNDNPHAHDFVAFESSQSEEVFWVSEQGNLRNIKYRIPAGAQGSNPLTAVDQLMYLSHVYRSTVDKSNPTRVFANWLEFSVDYSKPLDRSWKLVKNWGVALPSELRKAFAAGLFDVRTTPQGRTYAIASGPGEKKRFYELAASGLRDTAIAAPPGHRWHEDGSLRHSRTIDDRIEILQQDFTGLDSAGNPQFSAATVVASAPLRDARGKKNPYATAAAQDPLFPKTSSGIVVTFNPGGYDEDADKALFHLGGIRLGGRDFAFRASPGGAFGLTGNGRGGLIVNGDGTFNVERTAQNYLGSMAMAVDRHIVYNYYGEFWNSGQANQWMHWLDNGLFLGQFGVPVYPHSSYAAVGAAGNTFSPSMVKADGNIYVYHNDESVHGGIHRWRLQNLNSIQEAVRDIGKNATVADSGAALSVPTAR